MVTRRIFQVLVACTVLCQFSAAPCFAHGGGGGGGGGHGGGGGGGGGHGGGGSFSGGARSQRLSRGACLLRELRCPSGIRIRPHIITPTAAVGEMAIIITVSGVIIMVTGEAAGASGCILDLETGADIHTAGADTMATTLIPTVRPMPPRIRRPTTVTPTRTMVSTRQTLPAPEPARHCQRTSSGGRSGRIRGQRGAPVLQ